MDMTFKGAARRLDDLDLPKLGARIGVGEDEIHAFLDVETSGHGFDAHGRPIILFEPHVFFRNLSGAKRAQAVAAGLAYARWGEKPYPRDSYPRLKAACAIDETAALRSASWGLGQVLGENFKAAGFLTVQAMVEAMMEDEALQLAAAVNFIAANRLDGKLRKHDWAGFAKGYNGASFGKNAYDIRLAEAFRKWSAIKDTPAAAPAQPPAPVPIPQAPQPDILAPSGPKHEPGETGVRPGPLPGPLPGFWAAVLAPLVAAILSLFRKVKP
ncbi:MAG: N-acetylmuramidase family protein [Mesorhizobium sp.]|uniref:N-acetylmuramidase family protein n=1 Tax=Mesorhizobium sp. TaxID=1871066 RepID=UPI000FE61CF9|nr:N-acetylmuramidase family protein [Mesorhizobium sp.]RWH73881.1 MAG: N-acetylmuramidase family protein [Mesorhizobium sp.]RWH78379.1 MAG: N-acetylmuramidase family protein [Mesorhizobium sp.]RWH87671.1 MAG: N-acetylmuramidase family protein [Mesorhizobium sp.]RWH94354.1 MAG: N-acetylmuramidase family protein [Mesorhizobium sp.]RWH97713.1 MAG: N-acetylmuramidase family protein [Mesorhizobium sp.]